MDTGGISLPTLRVDDNISHRTAAASAPLREDGLVVRQQKVRSYDNDQRHQDARYVAVQ